MDTGHQPSKFSKSNPQLSSIQQTKSSWGDTTNRKQRAGTHLMGQSRDLGLSFDYLSGVNKTIYPSTNQESHQLDHQRNTSI
uniref:Putative ovule protein n=1 Tax=Solanum chacoense TaxID=4108 RepID=A0A0V0HZY7_SOLCH